jgi:hypothetical protein
LRKELRVVAVRQVVSVVKD